ncbi:AAA family ATPase [Pseudomonas putida]|uniref:AAA family ATPase n=1 Tax=Pseudomonas putida TaxID=303 RepID=UPI00345D7A39
MNSPHYRNEVIRLQTEIADLEVQRAKLAYKAAEAEQKRLTTISNVSQEDSASATAAGQRAATRYSLLHAKIIAEASKLESKIASTRSKYQNANKKLNDALKQERYKSIQTERNQIAHELTHSSYKHDENIHYYLKDNDNLSIPAENNSKRNYAHPPHPGKFHIITGVNGTGKSRYLRSLIKRGLREEYCKRIICLSGTAYDRFPLQSDADKLKINYLYFGNKAKGNILSEKAPFRLLAQYILGEGCNGIAGEMAGNVLEGIGFSRKLGLRFSKTAYKEGLRTKYNAQAPELDIIIELSSTLEQTYETEDRLTKILSSKASLFDLALQKNGEELTLSNLSSGERLYLLTTLALCFCVRDGTLILFDEPENSLHPHWQAKIIQDMVEIIEKMADECTTVIATHSPLIVSSAPNNISFICNLPSELPWINSEFYGRNTDTVLSDQFGLNSPRSLSMATLIQECLTTLMDANENPAPFIRAANTLLDQNLKLDQDDPLFSTITRIHELRERYS